MAGLLRRNAAFLWLLVPGVVLGLIAFGFMLRILFEDLPEVATREALEARFEAELGQLRELAASYPAVECTRDPLALGPEPFQAWNRSLEDHGALFDRPEILEASLVCELPGRATLKLTLKARDDEGFALSRSTLLPGTGWPRISLWYTSRGRVVLYETRMTRREDVDIGFELALDLELLETEETEGLRTSPPRREP